MTGQESIRGQVMLRHTGLLGVPIVNVENACASSSTAFHLGWQAVAAGMQECVLVVGYEKLYDPDKQKSFRAFNSSMDLEEMRRRFPDAGETRSVFMDLYASLSQELADGAAGIEALGMVSVKNHHHAVNNPKAQFPKAVTLEEVLGSRMICDPITLLQCSPNSGARPAQPFSVSSSRSSRSGDRTGRPAQMS